LDLGVIPLPDIIGLAGFLAAWIGYSLAVDRGPWQDRTLTAAMDRQRRVWVEAMQARENRISDVNILGGLQQGTAFFASASALAIGGTLAVLGSSDSIAAVLGDLSADAVPTDGLFDVKVVGLGVIFVYAFFKFGWSYRLFNYASILVGALPAAENAGTPEAKAAIDRAAVFIRLGGRNFNRGQRAFNFSLAYLGWLGGPWVLLGTSALILSALLYRQFRSLAARTAVAASARR
jgi:uncharacterized membrane protein